VNNLVEFLFCPIHGILRPANLQFLVIAFQAGAWHKIREVFYAVQAKVRHVC
jgi:hypothetical protein